MAAVDGWDGGKAGRQAGRWVCHSEAEVDESGDRRCFHQAVTGSLSVAIPTPANPQHVETRPRLMCRSFHVVEPRTQLKRGRVGLGGGNRDECQSLLGILITLINIS